MQQPQINENKLTTIVVIKCGYVESSRCSLGTAFGCDENFTEEEALKSLAEWFLKKAIADEHFRVPKLKKCCKKHSKVKFCPDCGKNLQEEDFDEDQFAYFVTDACLATADGFGNGWGMPITEVVDDEVVDVTPSWDITSLHQIHHNWDRTMVLEEHGGEHLAIYAKHIKTGSEIEIPSWYSMSKFTTENPVWEGQI